jgi:hypothetical protein
MQVGIKGGSHMAEVQRGRHKAPEGREFGAGGFGQHDNAGGYGQGEFDEGGYAQDPWVGATSRKWPDAPDLSFGSPDIGNGGGAFDVMTSKFSPLRVGVPSPQDSK